MAGSASFLGMTEFALRLPTALFGIATIVLQYFAGRRLGGRLPALRPPSCFSACRNSLRTVGSP